MTPNEEAYRSASGRFIVLEGIDGSGTTTLGHTLVEHFERAGVPARFTCEPSKGPVGVLLRQMLTGSAEAESPAWDCMALLFAADRLDHVAREISPALAEGITVVCDRYYLSSLAYQSATAHGSESPAPWIRSLNERALRPDLTLVLDVDPAVAECRRALRGARPELFERRDLQRRLAQIYASAERLVSGDPVVHLDANASPEDVQSSALRAIGLMGQRTG